MRRLPWSVALRPDRRMALTALGIALCAAFAIVSFAVPTGLQTKTISPEGPLAIQDALVARADAAPFEPSALGLANATTVSVLDATLRGGRHVTLVAIEGDRAVEVERGVARPGANAPPGDPLLVVAPANATLLRGADAVDPVVAPTWIVVRHDQLASLDARFAQGRVSYVLVPTLAGADAAHLQASGYQVSRAPGVQSFFEDSIAEVSFDLFLVVVFSSLLVVLFAYEFVSSEVRAKLPQIGLWRAVGMRANDVLILLLGRAALLCLAGYVGGACVVAAALGAAALTHRADLLLAGFRPVAWTALAGVFVAVGVAGAALPAWSASRGLIRHQMEAAA